MIWFLFAAAAIWGGGRLAGLPTAARWALIGLLWVAVTLAAVVLPEGAAPRRIFGGTAAEWLLLGALGGIVALYRRGLAWARGRVAQREAAQAPPAHTDRLSETELNRYARHITLREIGGMGQRRLKSAKVLVVGAGGLGAPALQYLAAAGVGRIGVIDADLVEASNLQRQAIHMDARIGTPKVFSAKDMLLAQNPHVEIRAYNRRLTEEIAPELVAEHDLVLDGSDNFATRYLLNAACARAGVPLIGGALSQWEGQVSLFDPARGAPCYACVFPQAPAPHLAPSCAEAGVAGPLPGIIGAIMALEAVKALIDAGETLRGRMLIYDGLYADARVIALRRRADCPVCGGTHPA